MSDIADFLLARIAEDEARYTRWVTCDVDEVSAAGGSWSCECGRDYVDEINPRALLTECEAKRRMVGYLVAALDTDPGGRYVIPAVPRYLLRLLALPYADHPDYRNEWEPIAASVTNP